MKKILLAFDSFKGSVGSLDIAKAAEKAILKVYPHCNIATFPIADGGEGTVEALVAGMNGMKQEIQVTGPLGTPVVCEYGIIESNKTAVHWCRMKRRIHFTQRLTVSGK